MEKRTIKDIDLIEDHPLFADKIDPSSNHPVVQALQAFKFESEDPYTNALNYKEEGNAFYKKKEFKKAICSYSAGNFRSCISDCKCAVNFAPQHLKAYLKGAEACLSILKTDEAKELALMGLNYFPNNIELTSLLTKAQKMQKDNNEKLSKKLSEETQKQNEENHVFSIIKARGIQLVQHLQPLNVPEAAKAKFYVDSLGKFHWSLLFLYPEFGQSDFLRDVIETSRISDCLKIVFDSNQPPPSWDEHRLYSFDESTDNAALEVYFEDVTDEKQMVLFSSDWSIKKLTRSKGFHVRRDLLIVIHVISKRSTKFYERWKAQLTR